MADKKQLNVRLTSEDLANVELLKARDVSLAEVIRDALRQRAQALGPRKVDLASLVRELEQRYPEPAARSRSAYEGIDTADRAAVSELIRGRLASRGTADKGKGQRASKSKRKTG